MVVIMTWRDVAEITTETDVDLTRHTPFYTGGVFSHQHCISPRRITRVYMYRTSIHDTPLTYTHTHVNRDVGAVSGAIVCRQEGRGARG